MLEPHTVVRFVIVGWTSNHMPNQYYVEGGTCCDGSNDIIWTTVYTSNQACPPTGWHMGEMSTAEGSDWSHVETNEDHWLSITSPGSYRYYRISGTGWGAPCSNGYMILCNVMFHGWKD